MPPDPPLVEPKDEMQSELCEETGATQEPSFSERDIWFSHRDGWVCMLEVTQCLSAIFKMWQASLERKRDAVPP